MISRRPNMRASSENDPGANPMIVMSIVNPKMTEILDSKGLGVQVGSNESPVAAIPSATTPPTIGVRKPIRSIKPAASADKPMSHVAEGELISVR